MTPLATGETRAKMEARLESLKLEDITAPKTTIALSVEGPTSILRKQPAKKPLVYEANFNLHQLSQGLTQVQSIRGVNSGSLHDLRDLLRTTMELSLRVQIAAGRRHRRTAKGQLNLVLNKSGNALDLEPSSIQIDQLASVQLSGGVHNASPETIHFKTSYSRASCKPGATLTSRGRIPFTSHLQGDAEISLFINGPAIAQLQQRQ